MTETSTALVETLTAEVRVLMVGNRQVTLSVYHQLDVTPPYHMKPFGRVRTGKKDAFGTEIVELVGARREDGALVRASVPVNAPDNFPGPREDWIAMRAYWRSLPLIVLAGLR